MGNRTVMRANGDVPGQDSCQIRDGTRPGSVTHFSRIEPATSTLSVRRMSRELAPTKIS